MFDTPKSETPVVPVQSRTQAGSASIEGNAVCIGGGCFLTTAPIAADASAVLLTLPDSALQVVARPCHTGDWEAYGLALLQLEDDLPASSLPSAAITRLDRWERLTIRGWLRVAQGRQFVELSGSVDRRNCPTTAAALLYEFHLDHPVVQSLTGLVGSGIFDQDGRLVGILSHEPGDAAGRIVFFISLEEWPSLGHDDLPVPWRHQERYPAAHARAFGREPILAAVENALQHPAEKSGYLVLLGGPQRGKSALMAQLIRRAGPTRCLWLFAVRGQTDLMGAENTLIQQLAYLQGRRKDEAARYSALVNRPGEVLDTLLNDWARTKERLVIYVDALDELAGAEDLAFLPKPLPDGVYVVISLRHEPRRLAEVTRYRPCLGVVNLDDAPSDLGDAPCLLSLEEARNSNEAAIVQIWRDWESQDGHPPLPVALRREIHASFGSLVGFHAAYARILTANYLRAGRPLPESEQVPGDPGQVNRQLWDFLMGEMVGEARRRCRLALGLIAAAREPLPKEILRNHLDWSCVGEFQRFLALAGPVLIERDGCLSAYHPSWNDLVHAALWGDEWDTCLKMLANGTAE
jgi:hypothetical protein